MKTETCICALAAALVVFASPVRARAQASEAAATALFDEGRKLMTQHRYPEACPKLAESQRLAPSGGTLLNLAECYEHTGQTASAWVAWKDAAARANAAGKADLEKRALARAASIEPTLARLTIAVAPDSDVPGLEVKRDGVAVGHAEHGSAIPVDPGIHEVEASAPKKKAWSTKVDVAAKQTDARVIVALAEDDRATPSPGVPLTPPVIAPPSVPPTPEQPPTNPGGAQRTVAMVVLGAGVVGLAVGSAFGLVAMSKNNEALQPQNCRTSRDCTPAGLSLTDEAKNAATTSTIFFGVGAVAVVSGVVLWLTSPRSAAGKSAAGVHALPVVGRGYGGLSFEGAW
jgi:hypothetical protein